MKNKLLLTVASIIILAGCNSKVTPTTPTKEPTPSVSPSATPIKPVTPTPSVTPSKPVTPTVDKLAINIKSKKIKVNDKFTLSVTSKSKKDAEIMWSIDSSYVELSSSIGDSITVTGKAKGTTNITAVDSETGETATCVVNVSEDPLPTETTPSPTPSVQPTEPTTPVSPTPSTPVDPTPSDTPLPTYTEPTQVSPSQLPSEVDSIQDVNILHAWNWSANNIASKLDDIKAAGYGAIQLSPMQPQKDIYQGENWRNGWWKLYQPYGFSVAQSGQSSLGTKQDLTNLCKKAEEKGLKIVMDIVSNHLAGGGNYFDGGVRNYEQRIYDNNMKHDIGGTNDNDVQHVVQGHIGLPDLKTEDSHIQGRVLSLLKEYIDCGVDGFRFDAAKHIETPDDGNYASQYWPTILNGATSYAKQKGLEAPYYYGEILYTCGAGRSFSSYTKYMSVIDNNQGSKILEGVNSKNTGKIDSGYNSGVNPNHLVLWAESHDTYANDNRETTNIPQETIDKTYAIQSSRKDAATLYFARPEGSSRLGDIGTNDWKNSVVKASNLFHNRYIDKSEKISNNNNCFVNIRGTGSYAGAAIVNINAGDTTTVDVNGLANGKYINLVDNKTYNVSNGKVNVTFSKGVCMLVPEKQSGNTPSLSLDYEEVFSNSATIKVNVANASKVTYTINGGSETTLSTTSIHIPSSTSDGKVVVKVTATNPNGSSTSTAAMIKTTKLINSSVLIYDVDLSNKSLVAWVWKDSGQGKWMDFETEGSIIGLNMGSNNRFLVAQFDKGIDASKADWSKVKSQTGDMDLTKRVYSYNELGL